MIRPAGPRFWALWSLVGAFYLGLAPYLHEPENSTAGSVQVGAARYPYLLEFPHIVSDHPPLVVALHGYGGDVGQFREESGLWALIEQGFAVLFVQGLLDDREVTHWNANLNLTQRDDVSGLVGVIRQVQQRFGYDRARTYLVGYSNGGFMGYTLACETEGVLAGVVAVNATMSGRDWRNCANRGGVPVMQWTGLNDTVVPPDGSMDDADGWGGAPAVRSVVQSWADAAGAVTQTQVAHSPTILETRYETPDGVLAAAFVTITGLDHDWPDPRYIDADPLPLIDAFFQRVMAPGF